MKLFLLLFLCVSCSVSKYYRAPDVTSELKKNAVHLQTLTTRVEQDYLDKEAFLKAYAKKEKSNSFLVTDLASRLQSMREQKEAILSQSSSIKDANSELIEILSQKDVVKAGDPEFKKIKSFSELTTAEGQELLENYKQYQTASQDFVKFALFTGTVIRRQ